MCAHPDVPVARPDPVVHSSADRVLGPPPSSGKLVSFRCLREHRTPLVLASGAVVPARWSCRCGLPAERDPTQAPVPVMLAPEPVAAPLSGTHLDRLRARRTDAQGEMLLAEALARLHARRRNRFGSLVGPPSRPPSRPAAGPLATRDSRSRAVRLE